MQHRKQRYCRPLTVLVYIFFFYIILCCLFSLLLYSLNERIVRIQETTAGFATRSIENFFPICVDDLLVKQYYHFEKWARRIFNTDRVLISKKRKGSSCRLLHYTVKRAVTCIDVLHQESVTKTRRLSKLSFVFMGDSRIRQQFYNFLKLIPDYDRSTEPLQIPKLWTPFHGDVDVYSSVLSLQVSFKWRPIINETVLEMIRQWSISDQSKKPNLLFLGMEVYHMMQQYGADFQLYSKRLNELAPILGQLASASRVIWLNQYPTVEFYGSNDAYNTKIHSEKVHHYNTAARQILKKSRSSLCENITSIRQLKFIQSRQDYNIEERREKSVVSSYFFDRKIETTKNE
ncbi:N-acetylneuraminate 9-O-acetyltransferase-like isoform X1 [Daphnia pulex]|uniref:N-acetylneuraminate 9-O-acetyltransferase-like isoform X1 n=1 Tax=Daphnia pulex TaxID=6669 RepID=UPI001EE0D63D|nr:N-acetylneuraminate 9-O-acetyltransferase-like isoform X1 [Daphnia pulex]